jgi:large subunit ribosomal protein L32
LIGDGFLFAVPIFRRTLEVRKTRKIGIDYFGDGKQLKILQKKNQIMVCDNCGHFHIRNHLCANCYSKVRQESRDIWAKISEKLNLVNNVDDKSIVVLYEGEKQKESEEFWNGQRVVEMEKPRPSFFSKNLLQKTTQPNASTKEVEQVSTIELKPTNLS